ncbi:methionine gamma-lyase [Pseudomonas proteolytica]|uniref:L-methionine gamma-lyase n=1 Tax=Pseudomonas proteolytica TaxID=219574 RepID=A0AAW5A926_9PSED|nr:methionine gamma-lyase [Pseudomonas proteolytica]KAA8699884.1 methionine gamma-lyase [Pseudomonas proteolytica]MCF5057310.1 methionine gamma-lyase [Pseudomonas proteolytica]MCF5104290.1 methionine gamma-lyase [Pseudomonas proteolytica]TWR77190.1 methionine gamma-lyase [Pseudomonas proteolytica]SEE77580.1 methionine-gamma-lyase [Pseudomonas proteolytica]
MNNKHSGFGFSTRAIHYGYDAQDHHGALVPPIYLSATFAFPTAEYGAGCFAGEESGHFYTRISNPTLALLESRMATLEGGEAAVAFSSGMGAIAATFWTLLRPGDEVIVSQTLYGCTFALLHHGIGEFGIKVRHVDLSDLDALRAALSPATRMIYCETPANPNLQLIDIGAVAKIAHQQPNITVVIDNTYCTPYLQRPLELGADVVVHSATKYLSGHGDITAGIAVSRQDLAQRIRLQGLKDLTGAVLSPQDAFLLMRGLKTLALRMDRHCSNAQAVAEALQAHPAVESVTYPGLRSFPQYELAARQMKLSGGMIAFELKGGIATGRRFMNALKLFSRAVSLGDAESLAQHPASMTHSTYTPEERAQHGIAEGLVRLSVGLEDIADLLADIGQALAHCVKRAPARKTATHAV